MQKNLCPKCGANYHNKFGFEWLTIFTTLGWRRRCYQKYLCKSCGHPFHRAGLIGMYTIKMIEYVSYMYLRSLSFNQIIAILGAYYEQDVFTKDRLIHHIEQLADRIPTNAQISQWLKTKTKWLLCSGWNMVKVSR